MSALRRLAPFAILPMALILAAILYSRMQGPYSAFGQIDPEYNYLFNALGIWKLKPPAYFDHPGTPLISFAALVILVQHALTGSFHGLISAVLRNPDSYLDGISAVLVALNALAVFFVGRLFSRFSPSWPLIVLAQSSAFLAWEAIYGLTRVCPEPALFLLGQVLAILLLAQLSSEKYRDTCFAPSLGVFLGIAIALKVTAIPWALSFLLIRTWRGRVQAAALAVAFFFVGTLPVYIHYSKMLHFWLRIATHSGSYGAGAAGAPKAQAMLENFLRVTKQDPGGVLVFAAICAYGAWGWLRGRPGPVRKEKRAFPTWLVLVAIFAAQLVLAAKMPSARYLVPALSLSGPLLALTFYLFPLRQGLEKAGAVALLAALLASTAWLSGVDLRDTWETRAEAENLTAVLAEKYPACTVAPYFVSEAPGYAAKFGDDFADHHFAKELAEIYSGALFYDMFTGRFIPIGGGSVTYEALDRKYCYVLRGTPFSEEARADYLPKFPMKLIVPGKWEAAYLVEF